MTTSDQNISSFLNVRNTFFTIPNFQRSYSWRQDNCRDFMDALEDVIDQADKAHFLGTIFYKTADNKDETIIVDGQQRITSVLLMLIAIYHLVSENPSLAEDQRLAKRIREEFLENEDIDQTKRVKLKSISGDDIILEQIYNNKVDADGLKSNLYIAYSYFVDRLKEATKNGGTLDKYVTKLRNFNIITIGLSKDDNLQKIFEGINSTGVNLREGDQIRNFALMLPSDNLRQLVYSKYWSKIETKLSDDIKKKDDLLDDFFRKFLIAHLDQDIKKGDIYPKFKVFFKDKIKDLNNKEEVVAFYQQISDDLDRYVALKLNKVDSKYESLKNPIFRMHYLGTEIVYPFLMSILEDYDKRELSQDEVKEFFAVTESYLVRRIIARFSTAGLNKFFYSIHKNIQNDFEVQERKYNILEIYKYKLTRKGDFPSNEVLRNSFKDNYVSIANLYLNLILSSYDDITQSKESFVLEKIYNKRSRYSIEHIMPKTLTPAWKRELGPNYSEIHTTYLNSLANLTLTGYNSEYSNKSFQEKLNHEHGFKNSPLKINTWVAQQKVWNEETLKKRIDWWLKEVVDKIWVLPTSNYQVIHDKNNRVLTLSELKNLDLTNTKPLAIIFGDENINLISYQWKRVLESIVDRLYQEDESIIDNFTNRHAS